MRVEVYQYVLKKIFNSYTERNIEENQPTVENQTTYPVGDLRRLTLEEQQHYEQLTAELQAIIRKEPKTIEERKKR